MIYIIFFSSEKRIITMLTGTNGDTLTAAYSRQYEELILLSHMRKGNMEEEQRTKNKCNLNGFNYTGQSSLNLRKTNTKTSAVN